MPLPTQYLTSAKNLGSILEAIKSAQAPSRFSTRFLEGLGFKSTSDRLVIGMLKVLGFLSADSAAPTDRYFRFLDQSQSEVVLAEGIQEAYADLFQVRRDAQNMSQTDVVNKIKTLTQGKNSESVYKKMGTTFVSLCKLADFTSPAAIVKPVPDEQDSPESTQNSEEMSAVLGDGELRLGGLHYNIQLILPDSRDPKVYDALFRSLNEHLLKRS